MSTCELDRFVIQTPYIKVVKSCSAPRGQGGRKNAQQRSLPKQRNVVRWTFVGQGTSPPSPRLSPSPALPVAQTDRPDSIDSRWGGEEEGGPSFFARRGKTHTGELFQTRGPLLWNTRFFFLFNRKRDRERFCSVLTAIGNSYNRNWMPFLPLEPRLLFVNKNFDEYRSNERVVMYKFAEQVRTNRLKHIRW